LADPSAYGPRGWPQKRIDNEALGVLEAILAARYRRDRVDFLRDVPLGIDKLRVLLRSAHELGGG
jgi:hypothetical protein